MYNRMFRRMFREETIVNCIVGAGGVAVVLTYCPNTFFSKQYVNFFRAYGPNGEPIPVRKTIDVVLDEVIKDLGFTEWNKKFYHPFICKNLEPKVIGCTKVRSGVHLGIPEYCQAIDEEEIKHSNILINKNPVDWDSVDGDRFLKSLQLSDNALKFLVAKLVLEADNYKLFIKSFLPAAFLSTYYGVCNLTYSKFSLLHKPIGTSIATFSVLGIVFLSVYLFVNDGIKMTYDKSVEEKIYNINESYIIGGIEYYQSVIQRNKALRNLLKNGHKRYSVMGNEISIFRAKGLPVTFKLKAAEEYLELNYQKKYATEIPTPRKPQPIM